MKDGKDNIVALKSYAFALRIIKLYKYLVAEKKDGSMKNVVGNAIKIQRQIYHSKGAYNGTF